jgi:hypothetical protein
MIADVTTTVALTPRPVASSVAELLADATAREPFFVSDSKSGSAFERVVVGGEPHVVKYVHVDRDWTMRFNGDVGCHPVQVWAAGLMDALPERIEHATVGVAAGLGRNGWGGAILMRDVGDELVPPGDEPLTAAAHATYLDDLAALSARMLGWRDDVGLVPLTARWAWFSDASLALERDRGWPDAVPQIAAKGWAEFADRAPRAVREVVDALRQDLSPLVTAVSTTPMTFVHGDWKLGNVGTARDGRTILIDWTYPGEAPPCYELGWYLALNSARLPGSKEDAITGFEAALRRHGVDTAPWYATQSALCMLGTLVIFGWEKALGGAAELGWWCDRALEGAARL